MNIKKSVLMLNFYSSIWHVVCIANMFTQISLTNSSSSYGFYTGFTCDIYSSMSLLLRRTLRSGLEHIDVSFADFAMLFRCICNTEVMKRECRM
jgi:hypothetical protein